MSEELAMVKPAMGEAALGVVAEMVVEGVDAAAVSQVVGCLAGELLEEEGAAAAAVVVVAKVGTTALTT